MHNTKRIEFIGFIVLFVFSIVSIYGPGGIMATAQKAQPPRNWGPQETGSWYFFTIKNPNTNETLECVTNRGDTVKGTSTNNNYNFAFTCNWPKSK